MNQKTSKTILLASADSVEMKISTSPSVLLPMKVKRKGRRINLFSSFRRPSDDLIQKGTDSPDTCETVLITSKLNDMNISKSEHAGLIQTENENDSAAEENYLRESPSAIRYATNLSRTPSIDQTVSFNTFFSYETFFKKTDFDTSTWSETIQSPESLSLGFLGIMAATVVIHPILFVTGAATAIWAVGMLHAVEKGYQFFSHSQFQDLFWDDPEKPNAFHENLCNHLSTTITPKKNRRNVNAEDSIFNQSPHNVSTVTIDTPTKLKLSPGKSHVRVMDDAIQDHFPPLTHTVVSEAEFPGLNALEFFDVFLADNAPYSFKDFQKTRGDIDVEYGSWDRISEDLVSFLPESRLSGVKSKLPTCSQRQRICKFKTLTNSYFGPAYANAEKTQRVCKFSTRLVIIESKTELSEIPFSDRFYVVERWVIEAIKHHPSDPMIYTSTVSVSVEIILRRDCTWEKQIKSKTISTITSMILNWIESATKALDLTIQRKLERMRLSSDKSVLSYRSGSVGQVPASQLDCSSVSSRFLSSHHSEQALMSMHQRQLKLLEEKITAGDLEWCSIEMKHSKKAGAANAFAEIINPTGHALHFSPEEDDRPLEIAINTKKRKSKRVPFSWRKK